MTAKQRQRLWRRAGSALALASLGIGIVRTAAYPGSADFLSKRVDQKSATFSLRGTNYQFTIPDGYCLAAGPQQSWADAAAAGDIYNDTLLTMVPSNEWECQNGFTSITLKTPAAPLQFDIPSRQQFLKEFRSVVVNEQLSEALANPTKLVGRKVEDVFGTDIKLGATHVEPVAADDDAGYVAGTAVSSLPGSKESVVATAAALTVVRGNIVVYLWSGPYQDAADIAIALQQAKAGMKKFLAENPE